LTQPSELTAGAFVDIASPSGDTGYYGLVFEASDERIALPNREPGEEREYGFVIMASEPALDRNFGAASRFGLVHADFEDPSVPAWIKTLTWQTVGPQWWASEIRRRRAAGVHELPLVLGGPWDSDDSSPVSETQLAALKLRIKEYFSAEPAVIYWELGLEENLQARFYQPYYWPNLAAKVNAVRKAANEVNPDIKLIYQIAETDTAPIREFLQSDAAPLFDALALHPYAWPDFPTPEQWLADYLSAVRKLLADGKVAGMPIWFTEVGAPHHGNAPGRFFGYPASKRSVKGKSRRAAVDYLVKMHVLALHMGVEKLFWYNYQDWGDARDFAEHHLGTRDYWGFPKPVYAAYANLRRLLAGKTVTDMRRLPGNVWVAGFRAEREEVLVTWVYPASERPVPLPLRHLGLSSRNVVALLDPVGTPQAFSGDTIHVGNEPVFVVTTGHAMSRMQ